MDHFVVNFGVGTHDFKGNFLDVLSELLIVQSLGTIFQSGWADRGNRLSVVSSGGYFGLDALLHNFVFCFDPRELSKQVLELSRENASLVLGSLHLLFGPRSKLIEALDCEGLS